MSIIYKSDRLKVTLEEPQIALSRTQRFDSSCFIKQVELDGKHTFCAKEPCFLSHPSTGGEGLCSEFKFDAGFNEVSIGDRYPKFGVGNLLKTDETDFPYSKHDIQPFDHSLEIKPNGFICSTLPLDCGGYSAFTKHDVTIENDKIVIDYLFTNTGSKKIDFSEYVHNFVSIDSLPLSTDYRLNLTVKDQGEAKLKYGDVMYGSGEGFSFSGYSRSANMINIPEGFKLNGFKWELSNRKSPASISESVNFPPSKVAVWSIDTIVATEVYVSFCVEPNESVAWQRIWEFKDKTNP